MRSIVHKAYEQIRETGSVRLFKSYRPEFRDGEQRRDFIYIKDAVAMTLHLAESDAVGLYNVGSGSTHTWLELVRPIFHALELPERVEFMEMPQRAARQVSILHVRPRRSLARDRLRSAGYAARRRRHRLRYELFRSAADARTHRCSDRRAAQGSVVEGIIMPQPSRAERRRQGRGGSAPPPRRDPMRPIYIGVGIAFVAIDPRLCRL